MQLLQKSLQDAHKSLEYSSNALKKLTRPRPRSAAVSLYTSHLAIFFISVMQLSLRPHAREEKEQWRREDASLVSDFMTYTKGQED